MTRFKPTRRSRLRRYPGHLLTVAVVCLVFGPGLAVGEGEWPPVPPLPLAPDDDAGVLPASVDAALVHSGLWLCAFEFRPEHGAQNVNLAGTFNNWKPGALPMQGPGDSGAWTASVQLPAGTHLYKFVVNGGTWLSDPANTVSEHDGHGGRNSILRLGYIAHLTESPASVGDGAIEARAIEHNPDHALHYQQLANDRALFRLRTLAHDVERIQVVVQGGGTGSLSVIQEDATFTLWEGTAALPSGLAGGGQVHYTFVLTDGTLKGSSPECYGVPVSRDVFHTPDWAKHAVWYQIMVDRFRNGDPSNDREPVRPWTSEWFTPSDWEGRDGQTFYKFFVFDRQYGGDLAGLIQKLPYLKTLGVNALYLNPVFKAESHHKYNAETYLHIDDHFGTKGDYDRVKDVENHNDPSTWQWTETDQLFLEFLKEAHAQGFKVIIDGVFNHVGTAHPAFQDVKKHGKKSKYADWFNVLSWKPFKYEGWFGHDALPVFKKSADGLASDQVKQYIFNVTRRWMDPDGDGDPSDGIDGWRLDVPNEIPAPFWVEWRQVVKSVNPDAYITGEIWDRAGDWLDGKHFDAVMNYEFARAAVGWVLDRKWKISTSEVDRRLRELRQAYPLEATLALQNLMNSHDTDRVASMAHNPDRAYDNANRNQDNGPDYDNSKPSPEEYRRARLTALLQMTYVGAPMVYYGDEVGMWGADDPTCRKPMLWEDLEPYDQPQENFVMRDQLAYYQEIIALRNAHPALRTGSFRTLATDDQADVWAFLRTDDNEQLIVALNASDKDADVIVPLPLAAPNRWHLVYGAEGDVTAEAHKLRVHVPAVGGVVLYAGTPR